MKIDPSATRHGLDVFIHSFFTIQDSLIPNGVVQAEVQVTADDRPKSFEIGTCGDPSADSKPVTARSHGFKAHRRYFFEANGLVTNQLEVLFFL